MKYKEDLSLLCIDEDLDLLRGVEGCFISLDLLVDLLHDETREDSIHRDVVYRHEEYADCESDDEHQLKRY